MQGLLVQELNQKLRTKLSGPVTWDLRPAQNVNELSCCLLDCDVDLLHEICSHILTFFKMTPAVTMLIAMNFGKSLLLEVFVIGKARISL